MNSVYLNLIRLLSGAISLSNSSCARLYQASISYKRRLFEQLKTIGSNGSAGRPGKSVFGQMRPFALVVSFSLIFTAVQGQTETIASGSFIINMGVVPQTVNNGLKPYGMLYDLLKNYQVPIKWVIAPAKGRDGTDFIHNGVTYKGGTFIIPAEYRTSTVNSRISFWQSQGVVGATSVSAITVPVYGTIKSAPRWALNPDKTDISSAYLLQSGIPSSAYYVKAAPALNACDDIFLIPHDDVISSANLVTWNQTHKGYIWVGCKSGSILETTVGQFLSTTGVTGNGGSWGSPSVSYDFNDEPPMQFMGNTMHLQTQANGANRSYTPFAAWRPTTRKAVYMTGQQRAAVAFGPGFGNTNNGWVMMSGGHDYNSGITSVPNQVACIRAMLNFSYMSVVQKSVNVTLNIPAVVSAGTPMSYTLTPSGGSFTTQWTASCGGTFSPSATSANVTYTPPANITSCIITVRVTDGCGRVAFDSKQITIGCTLTAQPSVTDVSCNGGSNGAINMTLTGGTAPYAWNWSRTSPAGTGSGTGTSITGLSAGTYNVTVSSPAGCSATFTRSVAQPSAVTGTATAINIGCFGQTGAVNLTPGGGTPPYSFNWSGPGGFSAATQNISGLVSGAYNVTITGAGGCTGTAAATVTSPASALTVALTAQTNVGCNGGNNGAINITASGGTAPYTYNWGGGVVTEDRSGLSAGTYVVTVTDANNCTATLSTAVTQPAVLLLRTAKTDPTCPASAIAPVNSDGAIDLTVLGGTGPFTYAWTTVGGSGLNPTTEDQTGLTAGVYTVVVTDANGCSATISVTLTNLNNNPVQPGTINNN